MANVFVEFANEEDLATEIARMVSLSVSKEKEGQDKFVETAEKQALDGQFGAVLSSVFAEVNGVIADASEKDAEATLLAAFSLLNKLPADALQERVSQLISVISSNTDTKPQFRLKILNHAHNVLSTSPAARFELFKAILKFAIATHQEAAVVGVFADVGNLSKSWNVGTDQLREVYQMFRDIFRSRKQHKQAYDCTVKYFELFKDESDAGLSATNDDAVRCVVDAINLPGLYSFDSLLELLPVKRLEKANGPAWRLANSFVGGTLDDYRALSSAELDQLKAAGLDEAESLTKIRHLTLATLGSQSAQVPYATVAKALQIDDSEVESYVVNAISAGIIDGRLDQLRRVVNISRTVQRQFTKAQWTQLGDMLQAWRTNVKAILQSIDTVKEQQAAGPQH